MKRHKSGSMRILQDSGELRRSVRYKASETSAVIDAGAKVTAPAAVILFNGGDFSRRQNSSSEIGFTVSFALPFWGAEAFLRCIDFADFALPVFFDYKGRHNFILRVNPAINELDDSDSRLWTVDFALTVSVFL